MARQLPGEPYTRISSAEAREMAAAGDAVIIDVRSEEEWKEGHVSGALWVPVEQVIPRFDELPAEGKLLFICEVGQRSGLACEYAAAMGADAARLYNIEDGTPAWIENGFPTSYGDEA